MRRTGNSDETKRILMDLDVVLKSIDCRHIVVCLGCFITASDVWICMELMSTCFDKLLKHLKQPIPEQARTLTCVAPARHDGDFFRRSYLIPLRQRFRVVYIIQNFPQLSASYFNATRIG